MVSNLDNDEIKLMMSQPNRAGILVPGDNASVYEDILMLVMPVVINR